MIYASSHASRFPSEEIDLGWAHHERFRRGFSAFRRRDPPDKVGAGRRRICEAPISTTSCCSARNHRARVYSPIRDSAHVDSWRDPSDRVSRRCNRNPTAHLEFALRRSFVSGLYRRDPCGEGFACAMSSCAHGFLCAASLGHNRIVRGGFRQIRLIHHRANFRKEPGR
jgi:hypothetical protein